MIGRVKQIMSLVTLETVMVTSLKKYSGHGTRASCQDISIIGIEWGYYSASSDDYGPYIDIAVGQVDNGGFNLLIYIYRIVQAMYSCFMVNKGMDVT